MLDLEKVKTIFKKYNKYEMRIDEIQIPEYVLIPLETENSKSIIYIIENQKIEENQILSKNSNIELYTYTPISGIVEKIYTANFPDGKKLKSALIKFQGKIKTEKDTIEDEISREKTLSKLIQLGIPWFNENSLFQFINKCKKIDKMILLTNGKDGFTNISEALMAEKLEEILSGFQIIDKIFKFKEITIISNKDKLKKEFEKLSVFKNRKIKIKSLENAYPYTNHEMIMHFLYNNKNAKDDINPNNNILLANIEDLYNTNLVIKNNNPYKEKFIAINGNKKIKSRILKVKIGTSLSQIINEKIDTKKYEIFLNNPANKIKIKTLNIPITRDIYSFTILKKKSIYDKIKALFISSFSPLQIENIIFSYLKNEKINDNGKLKIFKYTDKEVEEEIHKVQKEIKGKILNENLINEVIYTENNLKDIYSTIILSLLPSLIFSFLNNTKFMTDTLLLILISIAIYIPIMLKINYKCLSFFIYNALIISIILPLNLEITLKITSLLFAFLVFFYFLRLSAFLVNPILISFMFFALNFPVSFKQTYQEELKRSVPIIPTWNEIIDTNPTIKNLKSLHTFTKHENKKIDAIENFLNKNIFSVFNTIVTRFHIESLLGVNNEKKISPILLYFGLLLIVGKYIINKLIPLSFYISLMTISYIAHNMGMLSHISSDMLTLLISPVPMLLIFTMATEVQITPHFKFEQILYGTLLAFTYFLTLSYIPFETLSAIISIFILQISSSLIKSYSLTLKIQKIMYFLKANKEKALKISLENEKDIIKL
ncbi:Na+-translocating ferredoxin:NAD+ oxidoreductase RNF, RnfC subunit [Borreliella japonica]|uniref:Na+-translocating ferredoxin:NAD+ oxidoreductase RNF, RnfC subunit n=1 Tax=Borreliella japonica TaxID=34095 RepID=A0A1G4PVP7_BORJA|nr:RnfABCDGE type electron transport complex subunit D [Borreliella japonica]WKC88707.1 RnfABCDGE type electron transport complex subunit D [Borreliella japonica]SCW36336.1 Na+-translocating ferredoxin:NAD+ oxidoreductase RNF, RnfC subunit [Borreliella japonica]